MARLASRLLAGLLAALAVATGAAEVRSLDLAGVALSDAPWFTPVRSFDPSMPVVVTVDPARHPAIAGAACDIFVVAARSAAGWAADPTLDDATVGGPLSHVFSGASIADNVVEVAAAGELDANAGAGLGVPYDVVLDCNASGTLDDGDWIDGAGDADGLYAVHDTTQPGPRATAVSFYEDATHGQVVYHPATLDDGELLPLVVVSHGWTHYFRWYGHIGQHLASYGYIVMSHVNDVGDGGPGATDTAATATIDNIDYLLGHPAGSEAFADHVDPHRIVLIGHSTGGEGVVRAYTRLRLGYDVPQHYTSDDIVLLAPIAPVSWKGPNNVKPFDVPFHMFAGAADADVSNAPDPTYQQLLRIYERSTGTKQLTYIHGAGHADFHDGPQPSEDWADGPDLIGRDATHAVVKGYLLPLVELYVRGNPAALDYFQRMDDVFRPPGIPAGVTIAQEYRDGETAGTFVIDDYQAYDVREISSSGGAVTYTVDNVEEVPMLDTDLSFAWSGLQPQNGLTRADLGGARRAVAFDWDAPGESWYELEIVPAQRDLSDDGVLSLRAAQGTRHPRTETLGAPLTFTVTLRDGAGVTSSIPTAGYGEITRPYRREGYGSGAGWANEFSTVRIRLEDFAAAESAFDLTDVVAVRLEFGAAHGSARGRLIVDDIELADREPAAPLVLGLDRVDGATRIVWPPQSQALRYGVYRGTIPSTGMTGYDQVCFESDDAFADGPLTTIDADPVPAGRAGYYYLVAEITPSGHGSLGAASVDVDPIAPGVQTERPVGGVPCH